ncbi:MAG TPA: hypothetical protein VFA80_11595 [Xanthobacteraceae bacterium]|jgi:hypothetical protein|nr:hypothetical protein [Xanthobacteraceae bacterium]
MRRSIHEMSEAEKRQVADDLMLPTGVFASVALAAVIIVALLSIPAGTLGHISRIIPISIAMNGQ